MKPIFNPFGKPFQEVNEYDLEILKTISEGWYVEYKRDKPDSKKIAKSIASFANTHGGLYFIGIDADSKTNKAIEFVGVESNIDIIRDSVHGNIQPFPFFQTYTIKLTNNKNILLAVIPEGDDTPYIHNDGRIYRRNESASDPVNENNRFTIDKLYEKSKTYEAKISNFRKMEYTFCKAENEIPFIRLYINTLPFNHFEFDDFFENTIISKIINHFNSHYEIYNENFGKEKLSINGNFSFDTISSYYKSFVLRNLTSSDLAYNGLTAELDVNGNFKALIPLAYTYFEPASLDKLFCNFVYSKSFNSIGDIKFLNLKNIFGSVVGLTFQYLTFLAKYDYTDKIEFCFELDNCWRTAIYSDSKYYHNYINEFGLPICMKNKQIFPENGITVDLKHLIDEPLFNLINIFYFYTKALGLPNEVSLNSLMAEYKKTK